MTPTTAQVLLTLILLTGAIIFVLLGEHELAIGMVGAIAGQGVSTGIRSATNGNGRKGAS